MLFFVLSTRKFYKQKTIISNGLESKSFCINLHSKAELVLIFRDDDSQKNDAAIFWHFIEGPLKLPFVVVDRPTYADDLFISLYFY